MSADLNLSIQYSKNMSSHRKCTNEERYNEYFIFHELFFFSLPIYKENAGIYFKTVSKNLFEETLNHNYWSMENFDKQF